MLRGEIWWADHLSPLGSGPGFRRPVLIVQSDSFNESRIRTLIVAMITTNLRLAGAPGNVLLPARPELLKRDSVVNVSQLFSVDRSLLTDYVGRIPDQILAQVGVGLRFILAL
jgi:mRNA interferase MazF